MVRRAPARLHRAIWAVVVGLITVIAVALLVAGVDDAAKYATVLGAMGAITSAGAALSSRHGQAGADSSTTGPGPAESAKGPVQPPAREQRGRRRGHRLNTNPALLWILPMVMTLVLAATSAAEWVRDGPESVPPKPTPQPNATAAPSRTAPSSAPAVPGEGTCKAHGSGTCGVTITGNRTDGTKADCEGGGNGNGGGGCGVRVGEQD